MLDPSSRGAVSLLRDGPGNSSGPIPGSVLDRLPPDCRIAVARPGRLGDMIVVTPALRALRAAAPRARITFITQRAGKHLKDRLPWVDEVVEMPGARGPWDESHQDVAVERFFAAMRRHQFDLAFQCAGGGESMNAFVRALGAALTVGQASRNAPKLDLCMPFQRPLQPETIRLLDVMGLAGVPPADPHPEIPTFAGDFHALAQVPTFDTRLLEQPGVLGVHVGAGSGSRCWPPSRYAGLLDGLLDDHPFAVALLGTAVERPAAAIIAGSMRHADRVYDLTGSLSLDALIGLLARLRLFIGNDSGPAHLATALDIAAVIIYGSGHPGTWAPASHLRQRPVADIHAPCRSLAQACGCIDDCTARCIAAVTVEAVAHEARSLLGLLNFQTSPVPISAPA